MLDISWRTIIIQRQSWPKTTRLFVPIRYHHLFVCLFVSKYVCFSVVIRPEDGVNFGVSMLLAPPQGRWEPEGNTAHNQLSKRQNLQDTQESKLPLNINKGMVLKPVSATERLVLSWRVFQLWSKRLGRVHRNDDFQCLTYELKKLFSNVRWNKKFFFPQVVTNMERWLYMH